MPKANIQPVNLQVTFVDLKEGEQAPRLAAYQLDITGRPVQKLGSYDGKALRMDLAGLNTVALGPDVEDFQELPGESFVNYRVAQRIALWRKQGIVLPREIWQRFHFHFVCVSGSVTKCRPWYWGLLDDLRLRPMYELAQRARIKPLTADPLSHLLFPFNCQPVCDGVVEIYERVCCCYHIPIPGLLERLREILDLLPIPIPDPIPDPIPGPDPAPFEARILRAKARAIQQSRKPLDLSAVPSQTLYEDYLALRVMPVEAARQYIIERPYLFPIFCNCSVRKVGQTALEPGGRFDFCYLTIPHYSLYGHCHTTYAYKVIQLINGVSTVVYDGLAAHQYFSAGQPAEITTYHPRARVCDDGPGDPPSNVGQPYVMLEYVGAKSTHHFNFPTQNGLSHVNALEMSTKNGTYTTWYGPDCPWGGSLYLRLWFSPALEPIVKYYRLKVFAVDDTGAAVGAPIPLNSPVSWKKLIADGSGLREVDEPLGPNVMGGENDLFLVPYWSESGHSYTTGQFHQVWNTNQIDFPDGKYMLVIEVFDTHGNRLKPNGAPGPGLEKDFLFQRWSSVVDTDPVPFADAAHVFWVDNTPVGGDIVDLRKDTIPNMDECQFISGTGASTFAIGFRAFHIHGVDHAGSGDSNSFMSSYSISWQRGLSGSVGYLGPARPMGAPNYHTDVGETGSAESSGTETFANMLGGHSKCAFSVTLDVAAKHFTGSDRISAYDYHETASFALEI